MRILYKASFLGLLLSFLPTVVMAQKITISVEPEKATGTNLKTLQIRIKNTDRKRLNLFEDQKGMFSGTVTLRQGRRSVEFFTRESAFAIMCGAMVPIAISLQPNEERQYTLKFQRDLVTLNPPLHPKEVMDLSKPFTIEVSTRPEKAKSAKVAIPVR